MSELRRDIGLWRGIALNMIDMVGIGPFITIPLILSAMGGARGMLAWMLGGLLAISDGLVTAELAAELPASGGSYVFLREAYGRAGRLISFLFLFQILFSAPLSTIRSATTTSATSATRCARRNGRSRASSSSPSWPSA